MADRFAGLRASPTTPNPDTTILSAALHAMVAAIFARIFTRLEQLLRLWQSGTLPAPPVRCPAHNTNSAAAPRTCRTAAAPAQHRRARQPQFTTVPRQVQATQSTPAIPAPDMSPQRTPPRAVVTLACPSQARAPPHPHGQKTAASDPPRHAQIIPI